MHGGCCGGGRFGGTAAAAAHADVAAAAAAAVSTAAAAAVCVHADKLVCVHAPLLATAAYIFVAADNLLVAECASAAAAACQAAAAVAVPATVRMGLTQAHAHRIGERSHASHPREWIGHRPDGAVRTRGWAAQSCPPNFDSPPAVLSGNTRAQRRLSCYAVTQCIASFPGPETLGPSTVPVQYAYRTYYNSREPNVPSRCRTCNSTPPYLGSRELSKSRA